MSARFVTRTVHAYLDYPVAFGLMAMPFLLGFQGMAFLLSVVTGVAALLLTILTDHKTGLIRVLPYKFHVTVDFLVGVTFAVAPFLLGFTGLEAAYFWVIAATVFVVVALQDPNTL